MRILNEIAYWLLVRTGLTWVATRLNRRKILVLLYHGVGAGALNPVLNFDGMHVHVKRFERQMRYIAAHYHVVTLDHLLGATPDSAPQKPLAAITFDDGYRNLYHHAWPVLRRLALPATVFVITDFLQYGGARWWDRLRAMIAATRCPVVRVTVHGTERGFRVVTAADKMAALRTLARELQALPPQEREALLATLAEDLDVEEGDLKTWRPLRAYHLGEMARDGISVGGHGCSHDSFLHLSRGHLLAELAESKRALESETGRPVHWLAYPYGDFSREAIEAATEAGYRGAVATIEGLNEGIPDPFAVRRVGIDDHATLAHFIVAVSGLRDFLKAVVRACRFWSSPVPARAAGRTEGGYPAHVRDRGEV